MKCQKALFFLFFIGCLLDKNIISKDHLVNKRNSINEGIWKRKVGRPKKNSPIVYYWTPISEVVKHNSLMVAPQNTVMVTPQNALMLSSRSKELMVVQNNFSAVKNALPKPLKIVRSLCRKNIIGTVLGMIGGGVAGVFADHEQREQIKKSTTDVYKNLKNPFKTVFSRNNQLSKDQNFILNPDNIDVNAGSIFSENTQLSKDQHAIPPQQDNRVSSAAFFAIGTAGLVCIASIGYGFYQVYCKVKDHYFDNVNNKKNNKS